MKLYCGDEVIIRIENKVNNVIALLDIFERIILLSDKYDSNKCYIEVRKYDCDLCCIMKHDFEPDIKTVPAEFMYYGIECRRRFCSEF